MSTYRSPRKRLEPVIIRHPRSWFLIVLLTVFLGPFLAIPYIFSRSTFRCSRAADVCSLETVHGLELWRSTREFPQSEIEEAFLDDSRDRKGHKVSGTALRLKYETIIINGHSNVWIDEKQAWITKVNEYLKNAKREQFEIHDGFIWPSYVGTFLILLILAAVIRARTRFIIDYEQSVFRIEDRIFRTSIDDVPLGDIVSVVIDEKHGSKGTILTGVALVLTNETKKIIHSHSNIEGNIKKRLVEQIGDALKQRPS